MLLKARYWAMRISKATRRDSVIVFWVAQQNVGPVVKAFTQEMYGSIDEYG